MSYHYTNNGEVLSMLQNMDIHKQSLESNECITKMFNES